MGIRFTMAVLIDCRIAVDYACPVVRLLYIKLIQRKIVKLPDKFRFPSVFPSRSITWKTVNGFELLHSFLILRNWRMLPNVFSKFDPIRIFSYGSFLKPSKEKLNRSRFESKIAPRHLFIEDCCICMKPGFDPFLRGILDHLRKPFMES